MNYKLTKVWHAIARSQEHLSPVEACHLRLTKLSEEVGEVARAYIGYTGANARKGVSHYPSDVAAELCDVAVTALVALHDWAPDPAVMFDTHVTRLLQRIEEQGS